MHRRVAGRLSARSNFRRWQSLCTAPGHVPLVVHGARGASSVVGRGTPAPEGARGEILGFMPPEPPPEPQDTRHGNTAPPHIMERPSFADDVDEGALKAAEAQQQQQASRAAATPLGSAPPAARGKKVLMGDTRAATSAADDAAMGPDVVRPPTATERRDTASNAIDGEVRSSAADSSAGALKSKTANAAPILNMESGEGLPPGSDALGTPGVSGDDVWRRLRANRDKRIREDIDLRMPSELDFVKIEKEMKEHDKFHWHIGQLGFENQQARNDYYTLHALAMGLNKARWVVLDVSSQKGVSTSGATMRTMFWRESCQKIIDSGSMPSGDFIDGHPVLRPFADVNQRRRLTKTFLRGFIDARLKIIQQPANVKQLYDHFDKYYGYFYTSQLEILGVKNDTAEHLMTHIGRAVGVMQQCVLLWRKYARKGVTLLPADVCVDNQVNLSLLKNISLATMDRCVRKVLKEMVDIAKGEMQQVRDLVPMFPTEAWPLLLESCLPNYYIGFMERANYDVRKWLVEEFIYGSGFNWFAWKKIRQWKRKKNFELLVAPDAPHLWEVLI